MTRSKLVRLLRERVLADPGRWAYTFLAFSGEGEGEGERLTYGELDFAARAIAARLQELGLAGERALLLYPPGLDFVAAFLGCLYSGVTAVPAYPPRSARMLPRLSAIAGDSRPAAALTTAALAGSIEAMAGRLSGQAPELSTVRWLATDGLPPGLAEEWREPELDEGSLAFLQYTSGSTSLPKGVKVGHGNLLANEEAIRVAFGQSERSVIASWLPLYHDMGLIGTVLQPLYVGAPCVLMSPVAFLQRPARWLEVISRYRATTSGGPNFAYELCVSRIPEAERAGLDLASWEVAFNGAEPVRAETLDRFAAAFASCGFRREAFYPCYGLAEATLFVTGGGVGAGPAVGSFRAAALEKDRVAAVGPGEAARTLVVCGRAWEGHEVAVVDLESGERCQPDRVGEIWVRGPSVAQGYWERPEETERTFGAYLSAGEGPWLRTGDLGFVRNGELYVAGRSKDLIILRGRNHYPQDLELTAERSHPALRAGGSAAFPVDAEGEERLVVVAEIDRRREREAGEAAEAMRRAVAEEHEVAAWEVVVLRAGSIPKTSSGKIQRHACRAGYLAGMLEVVGRSALAAAGVSGPAELPPGPREWGDGAPDERRRLLVSWLRAEAARALGVAPGRLELERPLTAFGLDSLAAVELKGRVEAGLGMPVSLAGLIEGASLEDLAADLAARLGGEDGVRLDGPSPSGETTGEFPLSWGQRALWYLHRLAPESRAYHLAGAARVRGMSDEVDPAALRRALEELTARHPALRTTFGEREGAGPVQRVGPGPGFELVEIAEEGWAAEAWRPFDLERGPLLRIGLAAPAGGGEPLLFLAVHHLVADFWSLAVLARDLGALYARAAGRPAADLPRLALTYADWAQWQEERLAGPEGERLWAWWSERLAGDLPRLDLAADRPRPPAAAWEGDARGLQGRLGEAAVAPLRQLARDGRATLYMAVLAAFQALLHRYTGQDDLLLGSPTAGRSAAGLGDLVGYFVNPVVLRTGLAGDPAFAALLERTRRTVLDAFEHQDLPLALLAERLQPERDPGRSPFFDVLFAFEKARGPEAAGLGGFALGEAGARLDLGGLELESVALPPAGAPFDLALVVAEVENGLGVSLRFRTDLFDAATVERLGEHFFALLAGAVADPVRRLSELPLLSPGEERELLVEANRTAAPFPRELCLHQLVEAAAARAPEALAIAEGAEGVDGVERLTYGELWARAGRLARRLAALGVGPEDRVAVCLERSAALVVAELAALVAGAAFVPLDPAHPPARLAWMLADCGAAAALTVSRLSGRLPRDGPAMLCLDEPAEIVPAGRESGKLSSAHPEGLAYIIYTSGSTGTPKGVAVRHRGAVNLVGWHVETLGWSVADRGTLLAGPGFDATVIEIWPCLAAGAGLLVPGEEVRSSPADLVAWLARERVTVSFLATPLAEAVLAEEWPVDAVLRVLHTGGDRLHRAPRAGLPFVLVNQYGPTENTVVATWTPLAPAQSAANPAHPVPPSIGRPIANVRVYLADGSLRPVPAGVPGELCVAGEGLARGYLGRPGATAERFLPDPFAAAPGWQPGARLYRTGDLARRRADGQLEFLGRVDHQVKVRGFRIELGEVEAALAAHPEVRAAAVLARPERGGSLAGFVVPAEGADALSLPVRLAAFLRGRLPEPMVPAVLAVLPALPVTTNGKVDRRALAALAPLPAGAGESPAPRTGVEERVAAIWRELLRVEHVGVDDDFFALGGHSLLAAKLASRLREAFGVELPLARVLAEPTVAALARELVATWPESTGEEPGPAAGEAPLSFAQERLWFLDRLQPGNALYNVPAAARLSGELAPAALAAGLAEVVRRHRVLRTTFAESGGLPAAVAAPSGTSAPGAPGALPLVDLAALPGERREAAARELAAAEARRPFDLAAGPLLRATLLRLGGREHALLLTLHHIVADGASLQVLLGELGALYAAFSRGLPSPLSSPRAQFADLARRERERLSGERLEVLLGYWREALAGAPQVLELPADRPRPAVQRFRGAHQEVALGAELAGGLAGLARRRGATVYMALLAGFQALLGRWTGREDLLVGSPVANRGPGAEELIGLFANTLALRGDLAGDPPFRALLARARERTLAGLAHQELPFERLVEELVRERSLAHGPLVQVALGVQAAPPALALPGLAVERLEVDSGTAKFDFTLDLVEEGGELRGWIEYDRDLFEPATVRRLAGHLAVLLAGAVAEPERRLSELPLLTAAEAAQLREWSGRASGFPRDEPLSLLFARQVALAPEATALAFGEERWSYAELDAAANRLARRLRALGAEREAPVALCLERSAALVVAMLGVAKAGSAYVPLDPSYPRERLALMLADISPASARVGAARPLLPLLITEERLLAALPETGAPVLCLDRDREAIAAESPAAPEVESGAGDLLYVIYTSGSTGRPKGVCVTHRAVARLVLAADYVQLGPGDRVAQASNASFDAATWEVWGALLNGAELVGISRDVALAPALFARELRQRGVSALFLTTALFNQVAREAPEGFGGLTHLLFGGEAVDPAAVGRVLAAGGPRRLLHVYGPTESTTFTTWHRVRAVPAGARTVPIGGPIASTAVHLLDRCFQPVPEGVPGELFAGGDGLARGYLHRPELTAERFVPDPFAGFGDQPGARLYRTGDLVRWLPGQPPGGAIEFLGRVDEQVKVRGFRVEPAEIEAALAEHPGVGECAVVALHQPHRELEGRRLVAFWSPAGLAATASERELRGWLAARLPPFMVPSAFHALERLPLTPNGKVDRRALGRMAPERRRGEADYVAPRDPAEELLAGIWCEVLGLDRAGVDDDFFALGGHSLLATRVVSRVRETLGVELPLRRLFEAPTVAGLAAAVAEERAIGLAGGLTTGSRSAPPILSGTDNSGPPPLSYAQERLWFLDRLEGGAAYNVPAALRLSGPLAAGPLAAALAEVVRRHQALRTRFADEAGRPVQVVVPAPGPALPVVDLAGLPEALAAEEARLAAAEEARRPFDLAAGPLLRATLLRLAAAEHVLLLSMHHIAADGWSVGVLFRELSALYAAAVEGRPSPLPELPVQYADFARWQRQWLAGDVLEAQLAYWRRRLEGAPALLELAADQPRPPAQSARGGVRSARLLAGRAEELAALAQRAGATPFMVLLAAFQTLLGRLSGQADLVVGSPIAGRNRAETEGLIGFFVNLLALRADLAADPPFAALLAGSRESLLGAYDHQDLPFERLVEELNPERALAHAPVFQVLLALQNAPMAVALPGLEVEPLEVDSGTAKYDLNLSLLETGGGLAARLEFARDLFDGTTAERLLGRLDGLLAAAIADPARRLSELPLLSAEERRQVLFEWNRTAADYPHDRLLHEAFEAQARRRTEAVAVIALETGERWSYGELDASAERLAARLRAAGVGPEVPVGVCLGRSPRLVAALLAVLKAGGAYVPLDPAYPRERLALILADSAVPVVVTEERLAELLPVDGAQLVSIDGDHSGQPGTAVPAAGAGADRLRHLAYTIYTSGSTGRPKGVAIEHRSAVALVCWARQAFSDAELAGVLASTSICFDLSVFELFAPLSCGGAVVLAGNALALAGAPAAAAEVTLINTVPSAMTELLRLGAVPPSVRTVALAGEPLRGMLARRILELGTVGRLLNLYGPSEDTTYSTGFEIEPGAVGEPTIGRPIANGRAYVADAAMEPVAVGVPGELCLGGDGLARGYLGRPDLTAERFVPDPFSGEAGGRLYRTGDLARRRASGDLEFLGRLDHQVKVRGFRVEPGEVEALLAAHPAVRAAAAVAHRSPVAGDIRLAAFAVPHEGASLPALRAYLRERLPEHMVPATLVELAELPLTPNGKVDRRALAALAGGAATAERHGEAGAFVAPRTPVEEMVAGLWRDLLGVERLGIGDDFFALGGHSLLVTQVISRVREVFGVDVPLRQLFEAPTVAGLAAEIEARRGNRADAEPIVPIPREGRLPLSFAQERLWFLDRLEPASAAYNLDLSVRLSGPLSPPLLQTCLREVVRRHEALRTTFAEQGGRPLQAIAPPYDPSLPVVDLHDLLDMRRPTLALRLADMEARRPFDLARGPLLRAVLVHLGVEEHLLLFNLHHIVADGWSLGILLRELSVLYSALAAGRPSPLPELAIQYADFAVWQRRRLRGEVLESQLAYWRARLAGAPAVLELGADRPRPPRRSLDGEEVALALPAPLARDLEALARAEGATLFMILLAAFAALLHRHGAGEDLTLGSPIANRNRLATEGLIGFFVNTLVLRVELAGATSFRDLVARVREVCLGAYAHQDLPFEKLVAELAPGRDLDHTPLFQVMFVLQNAPLTLEIPGLALEPVSLGTGTAKFDLSLGLSPGREGLAGTLQCSRDLFDRSTVARLVEHFRTLLAGVAAAPGRPLDELPVLDAAELHQVLAEWGDATVPSPAAALPTAGLVHRLFEWQARRRPAAPAVELGEARLTYGELDEEAEQLAGRLRAAGAGLETVVGVCLERTPGWVVALLAILKAGGAYLPVAPEYPPARRGYLLRDSGARLLLTRRALWEELPAGLAMDVLDLDGGESERVMLAPGAPPAEIPPSSLAYVIYTSGSTGEPKGVGVPHGVAAFHFATMVAGYGLLPEDRVLQFAAASFDLSLEQVLTTLVVGATVVLREEELPPPATFLSYLERLEITVVNLPTAYWHQWMREAPGPLAATHLRQIMAGGEAMAPEAVRRWDRLWRGARAPRLLNAYGPTETVVTATLLEAGSRSPERGTAVPIGRPLPHRTARVLDRLGDPRPVGVPGELCLGGLVARGYLGRPELTAERFRPDPWGESGARLYRTGDLARFRAGGEIEYLGRTDDQVKVRGFRIELGEVEATLAGHSSLRAAAVVARPAGPDGERRLVAYVVPREVPAGGMTDQAPDVGELRAFLKASLPDFMVPAAWVMLPELPFTATGKVDRRALPDPERGRLEIRRPHLPPRTAVEEVLAGIWGELLDADQIGVEDDFFELGGHSLLAAQLASRISSTFQVKLPLRRLFETPTVGGLAAAVLEGEARAGQSEKIARVLLRIKSMSPENKRELLQAGP